LRPREAAQDYQGVKEAILDTLDITPETFRHRFRGKEYHQGIRPWALAQELKDACRRWLQPDRYSKDITNPQATSGTGGLMRSGAQSPGWSRPDVRQTVGTLGITDSPRKKGDGPGAQPQRTHSEESQWLGPML
uniref:SCAN box domain-containing protein n=1 Tax=Pelusios castaneus TaxID=367368 RepID=A0A8C8VQI0_9SAUR